MQPIRFNFSGHWSYLIVLVPYILLLAVSVWRFRVIIPIVKWRIFFNFSLTSLLVLGLFFETMAGAFYVWSFPDGRFLWKIPIPLFGWFTGLAIPIEEFLWIALVIPLFYYLFLWTTLLFCDIIFVLDEKRKLYKREERWVGFLGETKIAVREKGRHGREFERAILVRPAGFAARMATHFLNRKRGAPGAGQKKRGSGLH
jgi:hypothetical protein